MCPLLCLHLCELEAAVCSQGQMPGTWQLGPFAHPGSHMLCAGCSRNTCTAACHMAGRWGEGDLSAPPSQWTRISCSLPSKLSPGSYETSLVQSFKIVNLRQTAPAVVRSGEQRFLLLSLFCPLPESSLLHEF